MAEYSAGDNVIAWVISSPVESMIIQRRARRKFPEKSCPILRYTSYDMHYSPRLITYTVYNWLTAICRSLAVYYTPVARKWWSANQILASVTLLCHPRSLQIYITSCSSFYFTENRITVIHQCSANLITLIAGNKSLLETVILMFPTCLHYRPYHVINPTWSDRKAWYLNN